MSWGANVVARRADAEQAIQEVAPSPDSDAAEQVAQVTAAKEAAVALLKSGVVVNDDSQDVQVTLGGHATPAGTPVQGYGDSVTVTLQQVARATADA